MDEIGSINKIFNSINKNIGMNSENVYWKSYLSFILAAFGGAIGFGNLIRFPYIVHSYGGGAFLIPYFIFLVTIGSPIFVLELSYGLIYRVSIVNAIPEIVREKLRDMAKIPGLLSVLTSFITSIYFSVILCWDIRYLIRTFESTIPWTQGSLNDPVTNTKDFFDREIVEASDRDYVVESLSWQLVLLSLIIWIFVFIGISFGPNFIGRLVKITIPLPIILWIVLWIRSLSQPGVTDGLKYYVSSDFSTLISFEIWIVAAGQILYSLAIGFGLLTAYSIYNKPNQDLLVDSIIIISLDIAFSLFSGLVVFSLLGNLSSITGNDIDDIIEPGINLAFIVTPTMTARFPQPKFFTSLFFIVIALIGYTNMIAMMNSTTQYIHEVLSRTIYNKLQIEKLSNRIRIDKWYVERMIASSLTCSLGFIFTIPLATSNGFYLVQYIDSSVGIYLITSAALTQTIAVGYFGK